MNQDQNTNFHSGNITPDFQFEKFKIEVDKLNKIGESPKSDIEANSKNHCQVLDSLLDELQPIDFREYLELPEGEKLTTKHIIVGVVKHLLEVAERKKWNLSKVYDYVYVYNGEYWQQLEKDTLKSFLGKVATKLNCADYVARHYEFKEHLFKQFLADAHLPTPSIQPDQVLINLKNGTFEFKNNVWKLRKFDPKDFLTYQLPFSYSAEAYCKTFDEYLIKVLPDENSRKILQEYTGYIFTKLNLEKMLMLTGSGSNGKSVFYNILCALLGEENVLTFSLGLFDHEYNRAKLTNVLLNYSSEKGTEIKPDTFKALVSGEALQAREPYGKSFTLRNKVRFIINANEFPRETEQTEAYYRRYLIIPFEVKISEAERNIGLADHIIKEELAGVFNWLLVGLERIVTQKEFTKSEKTNQALMDFKKQSDSVALFVDENFYKPSTKEKITLTELYQKYQGFCKDDGYKPVGKNKFSTRLESKGFQRTRMTGGTAAFLIECNFIELGDTKPF